MFDFIGEVDVSGLNPKYIDTLEEYANCDMNVTQTALEMRVTRSAIKRRLRKVKEITGVNPETFYGLFKLLEAVYGNEYETVDHSTEEGGVEE